MSKIIDNLIEVFSRPAPKVSEEEKVQVNKVISKAALAYEKIRNAVDYKDEHLFRKNAIYRILKRKLIFEKAILENALIENYSEKNLGEHLLQELIRAGYFANNIPSKMIGAVDKILRKYALLIQEVRSRPGKFTAKMFDYWLEIEAVEIEHALVPAENDRALIRAMFSVMNARIEFSEKELDQKEKEMQMYLACHRALFKWDQGMIRYLLLTLYYPDWKTAGRELIASIAENFEKTVLEIERQMNSPWRKEILKLISKKAVVFWIIQDILNESGPKAGEIFSDPEKLDAEVKKACEKRYKSVRVKLHRGVVRSIIYVFFTKMVLALAIEFPLDWYLSGGVNYLTAGVNIIFPPLLMLFVAQTIMMPAKENTDKIMSEIRSIVFEKKAAEKMRLRKPKERTLFAKGAFHLIYFLTFIVSLMVIFWILNKFDFNIASSFIFVLFLTLVSFFGIRIRRPVKDILAIEKGENALASLIEFFALPFVSMGRWMSGKFSKINFIVFFLDFIIEAPFKLIITAVENMFGFLKEKKEEAMGE